MSEFNLRKYLKENRLGQSPLYRGPRQSLGEANEGQGSFPKSEEEINSVCKEYGIKNYTINSDMTIDVKGRVTLNGKDLEYLPLKFNSVSDIFDCYENELKSLEGSPKTVGGNFNCYDNFKFG
jgi:hypothetical protein